LKETVANTTVPLLRGFSVIDTNSLSKLKHSLEENKCKRHFKVPDALINFIAKIRSIYSIPFISPGYILKNILRYHGFGYNSLHKYIQEYKDRG